MSRFRAVLRNAFLAVAGHGLDDASLQIHRANPAIVEIRQVEVFAPGTDRDAINVAQFSGACRTAIAAETSLARAGEWKNFSRLCVDPSHAVVPRIGNIKIISRTDYQAVHPVESRWSSRSVVAAVALLSGTADQR